MKTLLTISTLIFSLMFSYPSWGEWKEMGNDPGGNTFYVDFDTIKQHQGDVIGFMNPRYFGTSAAWTATETVANEIRTNIKTARIQRPFKISLRFAVISSVLICPTSTFLHITLTAFGV